MRDTMKRLMNLGSLATIQTIGKVSSFAFLLLIFSGCGEGDVIPTDPLTDEDEAYIKQLDEEIDDAEESGEG